MFNLVAPSYITSEPSCIACASTLLDEISIATFFASITFPLQRSAPPQIQGSAPIAQSLWEKKWVVLVLHPEE